MMNTLTRMRIAGSITILIVFSSCKFTEKNKFLSMMSQISNTKNDILAEIDTRQEQSVSNDKNINEKIDKTIENIIIRNKNHYMFETNLNSKSFKPDMIYINTDKINSEGVISIKGVINYPSTNYPVEINQYIAVKNFKQTDYSHKKAYRIMTSSLEPISQEKKIYNTYGYKFIERSTDTLFLIVDHDFKKAYGIINDTIIEFTSTNLSLPPPDLNKIDVGTKLIRTFNSDDISIDVEFTLIGRDLFDDYTITEQKADVKLTSSTGIHAYSLNSRNGG